MRTTGRSTTRASWSTSAGRGTSPRVQRARVTLAMLHGLYCVCGGLWPLLHLDSFEEVTGNKRDEWLVRTVAGILLVLGTLLVHDAQVRKLIARTLRIMAGGIAGVLAAVAITSSLTGRISWVYFPDGLMHLSFALCWLVLGRFQWLLRRKRHGALGDTPNGSHN